jgi:6-pyruvoyltetrahydropterin/6-carboxytetrahydropterin synthase
MVTITRRLEIDAGHRLLEHEGKCKNYHGHRYVFEVTVTAPELDSVGRVIDFSVVKEGFGGWLDKYWDHGMILESEDPLFIVLDRMGMKCFALPTPPTAENLAGYAYGVAQMTLPKMITVVRMRVYETPNCWADYPAGRSA